MSIDLYCTGTCFIYSRKSDFTYPRYYQIKAGDQLWVLARRFQTSVEQIQLANSGIDPYRLMVGQILVIPSPIPLSLTTLGFIEPYNPEAFLANFEQIANELTYIAVAAFSITEEGYAYVLLRDQEIVVRSKRFKCFSVINDSEF